MAVKERELQRLKAELEAIDSDRARTEEEKKKMRAAFEEKVEAVQRHMVQLQKQLREGEAAKVGQACSFQVGSGNVFMVSDLQVGSRQGGKILCSCRSS